MARNPSVYCTVLPRILAAEYIHSRTEHARKKMARVPPMYSAVFPRILAEEYRAGLNMPGKMARVPSMYCTVSLRILAAEYRAGLKMPGKNGEGSVRVLYCFS